MKVKELINKYRSLSFENRSVFNTRFSVLSNALFATGKIVLSFFLGVFFLVSGIMNIFMMLAKLFCLHGLKNEKETFKKYNDLIGIFLILSGIQYSIYMGRLIYSDVEVMKYDMILGITVALISFVELGMALYGCFKVVNKGHFYRNIKLINLCSAFTAIVTTEVAIMSFASDFDSRFMDGLFGLIVGLIIILIAGYIFIAPSISLIDKEYNVYKLMKEEMKINEEKIIITLKTSKFYAPIYYEGEVKNDLIEGHIKRGKSPIWNYNVFILIIVITLSEILIFPYAIGALVNHFKQIKLIDKLDEEMKKIGYSKITC